MGDRMDLSKLNLLHINSAHPSKDNRNKRDIAIIGISAQIGMAKTKEEFWKQLCEGADFIREFPEERQKDAEEIYKSVMGKSMKEKPLEAAYLDRIDQFDSKFFQMAPVEADYMDPNQRMFLEAAWTSIQDAGYDPQTLSGSSVGVYLGYTRDENSYIGTKDEIDEFTYGLAVSGNVQSIIASRISYLLNLKGPAMAIDTACSSSLVALHIACQQMLSGDVSMALVGGIRLIIAPLQDTSKTIGIESSSRRTKTFDESADGTGGGEGVVCIMLKMLEDAISDHDNIYAVIKGSAINQDGASIGITAPNAEAQSEVLKLAWERAKVEPETISYLEAHGTATKLGDPVEITGIEKAFSEYTDRKQFCAIGSVKSNIGHLDCAAGLAGLVKAVLMLKYKMIPPTLHFQTPNRNIEFVHSPVYVNEQLRNWESCSIRRCGVSSFGISGTNGHVVLEEAPQHMEREIEQSRKKHLVTISAKTKNALERSIEQYRNYLIENPDISFADFCYTLNTGRGDYGWRLAFLCEDGKEFLHHTRDVSYENSNMYYIGEHKVVENVKESEGKIYITEEDKQRYTEKIAELVQMLQDEFSSEQELLCKIAEQYIRGGEINWNSFYTKPGYHISIPTYPFERTRHWIGTMHKQEAYDDSALHPYIDKCIADTSGIRIYEKKISAKNCWELRDHKINEVHVLPGTAFIEIVQYVGRQYYPVENFEIEDLIYLTPLVGGEEKILHIIVKEEKSHLEISCCSKEDNKWVQHVECFIRRGGKKNRVKVELEEIKGRCFLQDASKKSHQSMVKIEGEGWNNVQDIFSNEREILISFRLDQKLTKMKEKYLLFPAMLDPAINGGTYLLEEEYLPFSFEKARFYSDMPDVFYSYIEIKSKEQQPFIGFDIYLCTEDGEVFAELEQYRIKRIDAPDNFLMEHSKKHSLYHKTEWVLYQQPLLDEIQRKEISHILLVADKEESNEFILELQRERNRTVKIVTSIHELEAFQIGDFEVFDLILFDAGMKEKKQIAYAQVEETIKQTLEKAYYLVRAMIRCQIRKDIDMIFLTKYGVKVSETDHYVDPFARALIGFSTCINQEYKNFCVRTIDRDESTSLSIVADEIMVKEKQFVIAFRDNKKYIETMKSIAPVEAGRKEWLKQQGVYVITGGLGGMGLAFARHMLNQNPTIKVILLNRSFSLEELLDHKEGNARKAQKVQCIQYFMEQGYAIDVMKVDVSDYVALTQVMQDIHLKYGKIHGVIHAAGVKGEGFIMNRSWDEFEQVLRPKIHGTCALVDLLSQDPLDFFVMCSSITSIFGEPGQSQYAAANAFLNSYSSCIRHIAKQVLTIDWTGWNQSGMAVDNGVNEENVYVKFLSDEEGGKALEQALALGIDQVIVGIFKEDKINQDYTRYNQFMQLDFTEKEGKMKMDEAEKSTFQSLTIIGKSLNEISEIEKNVICAWANTLGIVEVDVNDKFFESGGNSLLASYLHKEISNYYPGILAVTDIFLYSTINEIATFIDSKMNGAKKKLEKIQEDTTDNIDELLQKFVSSELSMEELESLL